MRRILVLLCVLQAYSISTWAEEPGTAARAPLELQATDIVGTSDFETAQGPVKGYHATRSASATRTDTAIHETPQSISVVSRDVVEDLSATRLQDALDYAGGVGRGNNFGGQGLTTFTVRGFTTGEFYRNGFPINRGYPNMPDANTIERLEVLRGPATMLYGRGDPGGTFNVVSKQPLSERTVTLGSQVSDQGMRRGTLDTSGPLDDEGGGRGRRHVPRSRRDRALWHCAGGELAGQRHHAPDVRRRFHAQQCAVGSWLDALRRPTWHRVAGYFFR
jgi:iron complex outermembrane receptor protein